MGNYLSTMITEGRSFTLIASFLLLFGNAFAAPPLNASPSSLCAAGEIVLFSCNIGDKKLSLCGTTNGVNSPLLIQYRFGRFGSTPELVYPAKASEASSAFDFGTVDTMSHPLQTISFNRPGAAYDIMTPDQSDYARWTPFTGVQVTIQGKTTERDKTTEVLRCEENTTLLTCTEGTISVNLAPLKKALGLPANGRLSDALPKYPLEKDPYPIVHKEKPCVSNGKCKIKYPDITDQAIATDIRSFIECSCESNTENVKNVSATIARGTYLTLHFIYYHWSEGQPHGYNDVDETKLFRKGTKGWEPLKKETLFDLSPKCRDKINSLLYRQLNPQQLSNLGSQEDLLDAAQIAIGSQGLIFSYRQYELGAYAEGPPPVLLSYKMLEGCLRLDR